MRTLHRTVGAVAFGGLAAVTWAASGAFACSPQAGVWVDLPTEGYVAPGKPITIRLDGFYAPAPIAERPSVPVLVGVSAIQVVFRNPAGVETPIDTRPAPGGAASTIEGWTVPADAQESATHYSLIVARQYDSTGAPVRDGEKTAKLMVWTRPVTQPPVVTPTVPSGTTVTTAPVQGIAGPALEMVTPIVPPVAAVAPEAAVVVPRASATTSASGKAAPNPVVAGGTQPADAVRALPVGGSLPTPEPQVRFQPVPAPADLWSGVGAGDTPSLLDPVDAAPGGPPFGGVVLVGAGAAALAVVAAASGRRRLAFRRIARR